MNLEDTLLYPKPKYDDQLYRQHETLVNHMNDLLVSFQDSAYYRGIEVAQECASAELERLRLIATKAKRYVDAYYYFHPVQGEEGNSLIKELKDALLDYDPAFAGKMQKELHS